MVTSNNLPDKKVVKMAEQNNSNIVVPQRTLLGKVNEHITCPLCRGYYIDATTIVECLHSFCRSCIIKHLQIKSYCPVCEMMINSAKPNIKPDKALQDIVYKLVPGLFQREMERRQHFYASRPGTAAAATPEQRGEDTERIIFSPEDVISFSLEYTDATDTDSISSKSSDSNETPASTQTSRRYLQCPAVVNISHLKKFISMKYDVDCSQFSIDILYKRVPLPDYYTLMDIAYIYNWKRNEPMRFFFQITDFIAMRTRYGLFDIKQKGSLFRDIKASPTHTEDTNISSPVPNLIEQGLDASSGTESPMQEQKDSTKKVQEMNLDSSKSDCLKPTVSSQPKNLEEVEKSQFLNSFELTAKSSQPNLPAAIPLNKDNVKVVLDSNCNDPNKNSEKDDSSPSKRKQLSVEMSEIKKPKKEVEPGKTTEKSAKSDISSIIPTTLVNPISKPNIMAHATTDTQDKREQKKLPSLLDNTFTKRPVPNAHSISSPKRKVPNIPQQSLPQNELLSKLPPFKLAKSSTDMIMPQKQKPLDLQKPTTKKIPDLKPSIPTANQMTQNKIPTVNKVRMDLLANNSDPTIDRSKILSQVKTSLNAVNPIPSQGQSGDPLKSLFDSCKINIPSSLSITLTDQKTEQSNEGSDRKGSGNLTSGNVNNAALHKTPSPPVHNYIEVIKLPDADPKPTSTKQDVAQKGNFSKPPNKSGEGSAKGPIPSLKPISDTKIAKANNIQAASPITFQQTFEQQLQSEKTKPPKSKLQVPKLMPATSKVLSAVNKLNINKALNANQDLKLTTPRTDTVLDLSTPLNTQSQVDGHTSKKLDPVQNIPNMARKQLSSATNVFQNVARSQSMSSSITSGSIANITKVDNPPSQNQGMKQDLSIKPLNKLMSINPVTPPVTQNTPQHNSRTHTRSPSSSPKLVIAEDKNMTPTTEQHSSPSIQVSSVLPTSSMTKVDTLTSPAGSSKPMSKPVKSATPPGKLSSPLPQPACSTSTKPAAITNNPADFLSQPQFISAQHALLRHMEMQNAWLVKAQRQYDLFKNMSNISQQSQNKDKQ